MTDHNENPADEPGNPVAALLAGPGGAALIAAEAEAVLQREIRKRLSAELGSMVEVAFAEHLDAAAYSELQRAANDMVAQQLSPTAAPVVLDLGGGDEPEPEPPELVYPHHGAFVRDKIAYSYRREVTEGNERRWCPQWWRHEEADSRLEALWRAWEHLRLDPATGMSVWWRDHADHHMAKLFDPDGPFKSCSVKKGHCPPGHINYVPALPITREPAALFTTVPTE